MENFKAWIPLIEKMIWPVFIIILLIVFKSKVEGLYKMATEGRSLEIAGWLKIGEKVENTEIKTFAPEDLSIEALEGDEFVIEKGSEQMLRELQEKLRNSEIKSIDILKITDNKTYYRKLLLKYISTLGIKQVVFTKNGKFDGWIGSSIFSGQLLVGESEVFLYDELKSFLAGIRNESVKPNTKTSDVLTQMKMTNQNEIAVVDENKFKYIINKQDILTALVSSTIISSEEEN